MAQGRDHWRAFVRMVMDIWLPQVAGNFVSTSTTVCSTRFEPLKAVIAVPVVVLGVVVRHVTFRRNLLPPSSGKEK